jgi:Cupin-like domain
MKEGDALRIPEGWYHLVKSQPESIAINIWFKSVFETHQQLMAATVPNVLKMRDNLKTKN